jgi:hypothetical protein
VADAAVDLASAPEPVVIHGTILGVAAIVMGFFYIFPLQTPNLLLVRRCLQAAAFLRCLSHFAFSSVMLAIAYNLTPADGKHRAAVSGALIAASQFLYPLGALLGRCFVGDIWVLKAAVHIFAFLYFLNASVSGICCDYLEGDTLLYALFVTRALHGLLSGGLGVSIDACVLRITPAGETTGFQQLMMGSAVLGLALGPMLLCTVKDPTPAPGVLDPLPGYVVAHVVALAVAFIFFSLPSDLGEKDYTEMETTASEIDAASTKMSLESIRNLAPNVRMWVWLLGIASVMTTASVVVCSQVSTSLVLQTTYGWPTTDIALGLAVAMLCTLPCLLALLQLSKIYMMLLYGIGGMATGVLLLILANAEAFRGHREALILVVAGFIFLFATLGVALSRAAATNASIDDAFFSKNNFVVATYFDGFFIFAFAAASRYVAGHHGMLGFGIMLAVLSSLQCLLHGIVFSLVCCGKEDKEE